ncbi:hypothetical protein DAPPUDRAFT_115013 [Daphnia pulex]|uniref:Uncharacterized protein n=1 Tax=Daphnia pulex TaxID=6669 RepID=E9HJY0_DAPPU|nr:hypothetical protein DAPPUDRAFT_115013 [Daphnia pulex]|eukprot:EFX67945.1 hypothetical protein DAPPUDRAFT_115013 [Daphnia pulex]
MDSNFQDLHSGECNKKLRDKSFIDDLTITVIWNTNGAQPYKMSKNGIWPFMATINEAPYKLRRAYVILLALWFGTQSPFACIFGLDNKRVGHPGERRNKYKRNALKEYVLPKELFDHFVNLSYGINLHFLIHLSQSVLDWACLWTTSTFIPEWFNEVLISLSNGTQAIADKMASN